MDGSPSSLRAVFVLTVVTSLSLLFSVTGSEGQTTSITSSGLGTTISSPSIDPAGRPNYTITGGTRPGDGPNLFHSFADFNVGTNNVARFFNESGRATTNILSRVTGGQTSNIYGTIQTAGFGTAALWLINPAGIVFGPSASLNVGGSVHFSTADYLRLGSGNDRFYADLGKTSQLTSTPVTAFGFLGSNPVGTISVQGGTVQGGQTLSLVGRDRPVGDTVTPGIEVTGGTLSNPGGGINLISVGTPQNQITGGEINAADLSPSPTLGFSSMGSISLSKGASVDTSTNNSMPNPEKDVKNIPMAAGLIYIRAGQLVMDASSLKATSRGFVFRGDKAHVSDATLLDPFPPGVGVRAADITITADQFNLINQSVVKTGSASSDLPLGYFSIGTAGVSAPVIHPGIIDLNVGALLADSSVLDTGSSLEQAVAGRVNIQGLGGTMSEARLVNLEGSTINDQVGLGSGSGTGGGVTIRAREVLIDRSTYTGASGDATGSDLVIQSSDRINIQNSSLTHPGIVGGAGGMALSAGNEITLLATTLQTTNEGSSTAAKVTLTAPVITIQGGKILTDSGSVGAPPITFNVETLNISALQTGTTIEPALVSSSGIGRGSGFVGTPGTITVQGIGVNGSPPPPATHVVVDNSTIRTTTISGGSLGRTRISINAQNIDLTNGAQIKADTSGPAPGGDISLNAGNFAASGGAVISSSSSSTATGAGEAGNIQLRSGDSISLTNSTVSTSATQASGGNITLTAPNMVRLVGANLTSSVAGPPGSNGGNILIDTAHPQFVIMQGNSQILAKANEGQGGAITIIGGVVLQDAGSVLDASAGPAGVSGTVNIQAPFQQLSGAIAPLPQAFAVATNLYGQRCATEKGGLFSSFVQGARDGVPPQPGDLIPSPLLLESDGTSPNLGVQSSPNLAAVRLGLPDFDHPAPATFMSFAGCRS